MVFDFLFPVKNQSEIGIGVPALYDLETQIF